MQEHFGVIVVGSGLSGINAAYHIQNSCRGKSYVILEGRDAIGGTWDLFRYPVSVSDLDVHVRLSVPAVGIERRDRRR